MKKLFLMTALILISLFVVIAQTEPLQDFKTILIENIQLYFSESPKLTTPELKDLIVAYFSTNTDTVDLSTNGQFSGESLLDIYNKAKGNSGIPTGNWTSIVNSATPLNQYVFDPTKAIFGVSGLVFQSGEIKYFLVDPKGAGIPWSGGRLRFEIRDKTQSYCWYLEVYKLNPNNEEVAYYGGYGSYSCADVELQTGFSAFSMDEYNSGYKFIFKVTEAGVGHLNCYGCVSVFWLY